MSLTFYLFRNLLILISNAILGALINILLFKINALVNVIWRRGVIWADSFLGTALTLLSGVITLKPAEQNSVRLSLADIRLRITGTFNAFTETYDPARYTKLPAM